MSVTVSETLFINTDAYYDALLRDIGQAQTSIDIELFKFSSDLLGQRFATALINAAHRGVKIRVLVDGIGSHYWGGALTEDLEKAGIKTRIYHPIPFLKSHRERSATPLNSWKKILLAFLKLNQRNHRKWFFLDHKIIYLGSMNIAAKHLSRSRGGKSWRDVGVRLEGKDFLSVADIFEQSWNETPMLWSPYRWNTPVRTMRRRWHPAQLQEGHLLRTIARSRRRIWLASAYFIPDRRIMNHLMRASKQGIDVRILIPEKSDVYLISSVTRFFYRKLIEKGVHIHEYEPGMLHSKTWIVDDEVLIGSSNCNHRSVLHDLEADVFLSKTKNKRRVIKQYIKDLKKSHEVKLDLLKKTPYIKRLFRAIISRFKYYC